MQYILHLCIAFALVNFSLGTNHYIYCDSCLENPAQSPNTCSVKAIRHPIFSVENENPVLKPQWLNSSNWYLYQKADSTMAMALNLTWFHEGKDFAAAKGYVLDITYTRSFAFFSLRFTVKLSREIQLNYHDKVFINYPCFGKSDNQQIQEDRYYSFLLRSLPAHRYNNDHTINRASYGISIPDCTHEEIQHTTQCMEKMNYYYSGWY